MSDRVYSVKARIIFWVDADTLEVHPLINHAGSNVRVRLRDPYRVERYEHGHAEALAAAKKELGDNFAYVMMTGENYAVNNGRLVARLDPA